MRWAWQRHRPRAQVQRRAVSSDSLAARAGPRIIRPAYWLWLHQFGLVSKCLVFAGRLSRYRFSSCTTL